MNSQKARVATTVQVGDTYRDIAIGDVVDFDELIGAPRFFVTVGDQVRECPNAEPVEIDGKRHTPKPRAYALGELVISAHFDPVPSAEAPAADTAASKVAAPAKKKLE